MLALTAYVGQQSRGLPIQIAIDARTRPFLEAGREMFNRRQGQLNLSCALCHDNNWGRRLAGNIIPQAHPTGYPLAWSGKTWARFSAGCVTASSEYARNRTTLALRNSWISSFS